MTAPCLAANPANPSDPAPRATSTATETATSDLPDAPSATLAGESSSLHDGTSGNWYGGQITGTNTQPVALARVKFISAGQSVRKQRPKDKILLGLRESVTPYAMAGWLLSAGWSQLLDLSPNYGVNSEAFGQRLGAAAALNSSKEVFSDSVLATAFHQDPRYYQLGPDHKFFNRALYAVTRPVIGRTDSGKTIPNYAFILGTGAAVSLAQTYYPERNMGVTPVMRGWGTSLAGTAGGYLVSEFADDFINWLHIRKHE
ncbi:MAG: hypothetical protein PW789_10740 [Edaphobacter sp.]|uniref:hypothetical protein n=1 Tax=Edaphobacter sp. TaxID=1934404 RepID=UPI0023837F0D|nr:hypothetical protein [Edaphobacter sp.]MDE1177066.1 hypothetical protein [Edaphobacter sp.]